MLYLRWLKTSIFKFIFVTLYWLFDYYWTIHLNTIFQYIFINAHFILTPYPFVDRIKNYSYNYSFDEAYYVYSKDPLKLIVQKVHIDTS